MSGQPLAVALVHAPVLDRRGDRVVSAVTNLDLHDIARSARTYGAQRFYVVTPAQEQVALVARIVRHWCQGHGAAYHADRAEALRLIETAPSLEVAVTAWEEELDRSVRPILTSAARHDGISFAACRQLRAEHPLLLVLGTGWGLAPEIFDQGWTVLEPVCADADYNHLSVRAAAAIILDRLHLPETETVK